MAHYILQIVAFQLVFLIIYDLFLKNETFFSWNRLYLLITGLGSIVLPFIKFDSMKRMVPKQFVIQLPEVIIGDLQPISRTTLAIIQPEVINTSNFLWNWQYVIYIGMFFATILFLYKIIKISSLIQKNPKRWKGNLILVNLLNSNAAFSFFHYVFLGEWIKDEEKETVFKHEVVHVTQKHSWDLLVFELLRIVFWFNPLIYIYQNRITTLHEFIADAIAIKQSDKKQYYEKMLSQVFDTEQISFTNTFFNQSLIKKRIVMLSKSKSNRIYLLKYALLIPMVFGMLMYTSSYAQNESTNINVSQEMTLRELVNNYYKVIKGIETKDGFDKIFKTFMSNNENYIWTKDQLARNMAFFEYMNDKMIQKNSEDDTLTEEYAGILSNMVINYNTYDDYLAYMKTDKAKSSWESQIKNGVLRLVVDDMKNLTEAERKRQEEKITLIEKDDFFHGLLMTDGKTSTTMEFHSIDGKEIPNPNNNNEDEVTDSSDIEVPFSIIDEVPTMESCKDLVTNDEKRQCFSDFISDFVNHNFNTKIAKDLGLKGRQRISVLFRIGTDGKIKNVMSSAPHPALEAEAKRVVSLLPQMTPGKQRGKTVVVPYSLPILFQVSD